MCDKKRVFIVYERNINPQTGFTMYTRNIEVHCEEECANKAAEKYNSETKLKTVQYEVETVKLINDGLKS